MEPITEAVKTNNSVIVLFVVVGIVLILAGDKLIKAITAATKAKADAEEKKTRIWLDREKEILKVIQQNAESNSQMSQVLNGIKGFLENTTMQQRDIFDNLKDGHEEIKDGQQEILREVHAINVKLGGGRAEQ